MVDFFGVTMKEDKFLSNNLHSECRFLIHKVQKHLCYVIDIL